MKSDCPICKSGISSFYEAIDGFDYMQCATCGSLHIDSDVLNDIDAGKNIRLYDSAYWQEELRAARERASGLALARSGEAILYARRPVKRFLDIGTGPGYLLDELAKQLPGRANMFFGIELFPPEEHSTHPNYRVGEVADMDVMFDAGVCIEVVEHLTPRMLARLASGLAKVSNPGALWLFNTGMPDYVLKEDRGYLDPLHRGHIVSYAVAGLARIFEPLGFRIKALPGKSYAFLAEFQPPSDDIDFGNRIYHPLPENKALLEESGLLYQAAFEAARSSYYQAEYMARTEWALQLKRELGAVHTLFAVPGKIKKGLFSGMRKLPKSAALRSDLKSKAVIDPKDNQKLAVGSVRLFPPPAHVMSPPESAALSGERLSCLCPICGTQNQLGCFTENLRESGACTHCGSSNRQRQMAWMLRRELGLPLEGKLVIPDGMVIYNTEASGPLHEVLKSHPQYRCSEYWGDKSTFGERVDGVRNEDLQALSFDAAVFDVVLSSDVLEHMPSPYQAHHEIFRVLKPGGRHIFTVPYGEAMVRDNVRASLIDGKIVHHAEALYHGDPVRPAEGILVWTIFGLEMLVRLNEIGFETDLWRLHEPEYGIIGPGADIFVARVPS